MDYSAHTDLMIFAVFGLLLVLAGLVGTRWDRKRKGEPPRYLGYVKPEHYKDIHGYSPVMQDWDPKLGTIVSKGGYGNE